MFDFSASWSSCSWVAWTRNLIAYSDMMTMAAIALTRCIYITCSQVINCQLCSYSGCILPGKPFSCPDCRPALQRLPTLSPRRGRESSASSSGFSPSSSSAPPPSPPRVLDTGATQTLTVGIRFLSSAQLMSVLYTTGLWCIMTPGLDKAKRHLITYIFGLF